MNNNFDFNLNNYKFVDLLNLYNLESITNNDKLIMEKKLNKIRDKFTDTIYIFYLKVYKIIRCLNELYNKNIIIDTDNETNIEGFITSIKNVDSFENKTIKEIISFINFTQQNPNNFSEYSADILDDKPRMNNLQVHNNDTNIILNTLPNSVAPGNLNSIKRITYLQNLNLNSCFRHNYYNSNPCDFQYTLPLEIKNVVSMRLASIEIPNSWYLFSKKTNNNTFIIEVVQNGVTTEYPIVVPDGNYDSDTLVTYLNKTYFYESPNVTSLSYIIFSINQYNFKSKFELVDTTPANYTFNLILMTNNININMMTTFGWILGFRLAKYTNIDKCIFSEGLFDAGGDRYIYMCVNDYQYNNNVLNIVGFDNSTMEENILAKIPMMNGKLSLIIDDNTNPLTKTRKYNGPVNISNLQIKILDKFGSIIDLNNMDFSFTLELEILYEGFNFKNITF
jgi:hypothetical protein